MAKLLVSGLINTETTAKVRGFPIEYFPIDYPFFGVGTSASGVALNIAAALAALGDEVALCSMVGDDLTGRIVLGQLRELGIPDDYVVKNLRETPQSVVLYEPSGRRQIYCDLKDIQDAAYGFTPEMLADVDAVLACNINFNRPLLKLAKEAGRTVASDVHVLSDIEDGYNRDFLEAADILFLSDEGIDGDCREFLSALAGRYAAKVIVLGRGGKGALMYLREGERFVEKPAREIGGVVNTVGAGDALFSAFNHFYFKGFSAEEALDRAQLFAAMKIRTSGAAKGFPTEKELLAEEL